MIREAYKKDCINLQALSLEVWINTYCIDGINTQNSEYIFSTFTKEYFLNILKNDKYKLLVYTEEEYLRAYILINLDSQYKNKNKDFGFEVDKLYVHTSYQNKRIGKKLLNEVNDKYGEKFWLITWNRNKSIAFYLKYGFIDIEEHTFSYGNEDIKNRVLFYAT